MLLYFALLVCIPLPSLSLNLVRKKRSLEGPPRWSAWSTCSTTCGEGVQRRTRDCVDSVCTYVREDARRCTSGPCLEWQPWNHWTGCSVSCGEGSRTRTRFCPNYFGCGAGERSQTERCLGSSQCEAWRPWGVWRTCSAACGGGTQERQRDCTVQYGCQGDPLETRECNTHSCCTNWSLWSRCSVTCGGPEDGLRTRSRRCTIEAPGAFGGYASKEETEQDACDEFLEPCVTWSEWSEWGICSAPCGNGERRRERQCPISGACPGSSTGYESCNNGPCAEWREWARWSLCSITCGGGVKTRQRICSAESQCDGDALETAACGNFPCPDWSNWGPWSYCTESCGGGWQKRGRVCNMYNLCGGDKNEKRLCNTHQCSRVDEWGNWGECSQLCGGGFQIRDRSCISDAIFCSDDNAELPSCVCDDQMQSAQACNSHRCSYWNRWEAWGSCSSPCGGGVRNRERECVIDTGFCVGDNRLHPSCLCDGEDYQSEECGSSSCAEWSEWHEWGECDAKCGGGARERKRQCIRDEAFCANQAPNHPACICPGLDHSNDQCNAHLCPMWARWRSWSACSASCEGGVKQRERICQNDPDYCPNAGLDELSCQCDGSAFDDTECNTHTCAHWIKWSHWSECSASCGGGQQTRTRHCQTDVSKCYGVAMFTDPSCQCLDDKEELGNCNLFSCPRWNNWADWSGCSVSCGAGVRDRKRQCDYDVVQCNEDPTLPGCQCDGTDLSAEPCDAGPCFSWSVWSKWSSCSRVCGGGSRNRARECPEPGSCPGLGSETEFCNQVTCPEWGDWSPWSDCSVTCGGGQRARTRSCPLKGGCFPGKPLESELCMTDTCPKWSEWTPWSICSRTCGPGQRVRSRDCNPISDGCLGRPEDVEECFDRACDLLTHWSDWSPCTMTCGGGVKTRSRVTCPTCDPEDDVTSCEEQACPEWSFWQPWSECSVQCGGGQRVRDRLCVDGATGNEVPRGCVGKTQEIDSNPCNNFSC